MRKRQNSGGGAEPNCSDSGSETEKEEEEEFFQHKIFFTEGGRTNKVRLARFNLCIEFEVTS
jgi:hypothetical protein